MIKKPNIYSFLYAIGVGAEKFNGQIDNTEIKGKILGEE